jgi:hypothetical protein
MHGEPVDMGPSPASGEKGLEELAGHLAIGISNMGASEGGRPVEAIKDWLIRHIQPIFRSAVAEAESRWKARAEQAETQLAGCGVAALGWSRGEQKAKQGDWGWSASYQDVLDLREKWEASEQRHAAEIEAKVEEFAKVLDQPAEFNRITGNLEMHGTLFNLAAKIRSISKTGSLEPKA